MTAVQIFNNPNILFKSETFVVLIIISWTYLAHAYYRNINLEYRYYSQHGKRRFFEKTKKGAFKFWSLEDCINKSECPFDKNACNNLHFLIGLRHEIEHQMTSRLDDALSAKFQACCINYNHYIKKLFGDEYGIDKHLSFSLQFSSISSEQKDNLSEYQEFPKSLIAYIIDFDNSLTYDEYNNPQYSYRMLFLPKSVNRKGQADKVIEFVQSDSELAEKINAEYTIIKEKDKKKYIPSQIVALMNEEGYTKFTMHKHTKLWQKMNAKDPNKDFGVDVANKYWYWYDNWLEIVRNYCKKNFEKEEK
jgi:hypothetical protein